jgi:glycopeptide antibiotics resistance protein
MRWTALKTTTGFPEFLDRFRVAIRLTYVGVLVLATLSAFRIDGDPAAVARRLRRMLDPTVSARDAIDGARNVLLFAGWGLVWMVTAAPGRSVVIFRNAVLTGAGLSLTIEALQLFSTSRTASVLDLVTNTVGTALGAIFLVTLVTALSARRGQKSFTGVPAAIFGVSSALALLGESLVPLYRQELQPWATGGPLERVSRALAEFRWGSLGEWPIGDALLFLPGGLFAVATLSEMGVSYRRAAGLVSVTGVLLFAVAEVAHGALGQEVLGGAGLVHAAAVAAGAALALWGLPAFTVAFRGVSRPRLLLGGYVAWLMSWAFRPYLPETTLGAVAAKFSGEWWIPLRFLGARVDMFSVVDVVVGFCLFLPVGALLAVWPLRLRGGLGTILPAAYLAITLEFLQALVSTRTVAITDMLVPIAGAAIGWTIVRRAGFRPYGEQLG